MDQQRDPQTGYVYSVTTPRPVRYSTGRARIHGFTGTMDRLTSLLAESALRDGRNALAADPVSHSGETTGCGRSSHDRAPNSSLLEVYYAKR